MKVHVAEQGFEPKPVRAEHGGCTETTSLPSAPDWGLGLLTLQPVLPQEAVLPLFYGKRAGTESSPYLQPTKDPADLQEHRSCAGAAWAGAQR